MPNVSAIIVNYNAGLILQEVIHSLLCSTSVTKAIVVDNASCDESVSLLEQEFRDEQRIHILRSNKNLGFAKACNIGIAAAESE